MSDAWVPDLVPALLLSLLLSLLAGLQRVSAWETEPRCVFYSNCPQGFTCCSNGCCQETGFFSGPFRVFIIIFIIIVPLVCICTLAKHFCRRCRQPEQDPAVDHQRRPDPPSVVPLEGVWTTTSEPPPPYSEVILKPALSLAPTEPPPPYSLRPEDQAGVRRGIDNPAFGATTSPVPPGAI